VFAFEMSSQLRLASKHRCAQPTFVRASLIGISA